MEEKDHQAESNDEESLSYQQRKMMDDELGSRADDLKCVDEETLSHKETMAIVQSMLKGTISTDPLLGDLPLEVTLEEVTSSIALEYGQAMTVYIDRDDGNTMPVVVQQDARVQDLKHAIRRYVTLQETRRNGIKSISWKYIWKRHWLYFDGQKLTDDGKKLKEYGIYNRATLTFINRLKQRK
ncbi:U11/U12 small nuclear ribonucleoprotein 25 kDa protein-like [Gigantopelta aegis]|uniref:U11/U12 small nuclear ribonucleoprotein 25 kDa protein-like n=1 Tax=Gigantopelta aegis TaxID=1735272 RepID=UPI001B88B975|nr:U11/U12 small nuclear ribonucleoprotein 25 kDa protein-like [Gigantopelta aegis]